MVRRASLSSLSENGSRPGPLGVSRAWRRLVVAWFDQQRGVAADRNTLPRKLQRIGAKRSCSSSFEIEELKNFRVKKRRNRVPGRCAPG